MDNIAIIHNRGNAISESLETVPHLIWRTCLREIIFLHARDLVHFPSAENVQKDQDAYRELLEIICGLHSPVLGETQVFGQYKNFLKENQDSDSLFLKNNRSFFQSLNNDAKAVREEFRGLLSSAGYGSISRKLLKDCHRLAIIGSGELASEIYTLIKSKECTVFTRNTEKDFFGESLQPLERLHGDFDGVILAAPVCNSVLKPFVTTESTETQWKMIIDWRAESSLFPEPKNMTYYPISTLFQIVEQEKLQSKAAADRVRLQIAERAKQFCERVNIRPMGWDDVCA